MQTAQTEGEKKEKKKQELNYMYRRKTSLFS